ncbi:MAG: hypothetical protein P8J37_21955 [Fuerstiella sp.]|nr:hypothetical protein [Fuerstiella sp.]
MSGSVKYFDVGGLLSLCAPHDVSVIGLKYSSIARKVFSAAGVSDKLRLINLDALESTLEQL